MQRSTRLFVTVSAAALAFSILAAAPAAAGGAGDNVVRFGGAFVSPSGDLTQSESERIPLGGGLVADTELTLKAEADDGFGFFVGYEHYFSDLLGLEVTALRSDLDVNVTATGTVRLIDQVSGQVIAVDSISDSVGGSTDVTPVTFGLNFHFGSGVADWYAGPFVGYALFGDLDFGDGDSSGLDDDFTFGAGAGVDVPFGSSGWMFNGAVRYYKLTAKASDGDGTNDELDLDPLVVQAGVGYRF